MSSGQIRRVGAGGSQVELLMLRARPRLMNPAHDLAGHDPSPTVGGGPSRHGRACIEHAHNRKHPSYGTGQLANRKYRLRVSRASRASLAYDAGVPGSSAAGPRDIVALVTST